MIEFSKKLEELELKTLSELGEIQNKFGKKYKDIKIKDIYEKNPQYFKWVKGLGTTKNYLGTQYYFEWEYSRRAIVLYDELMDFYNNQGK